MSKFDALFSLHPNDRKTGERLVRFLKKQDLDPCFDPDRIHLMTHYAADLDKMMRAMERWVLILGKNGMNPDLEHTRKAAKRVLGEENILIVLLPGAKAPTEKFPAENTLSLQNTSEGEVLEKLEAFLRKKGMENKPPKEKEKPHSLHLLCNRDAQVNKFYARADDTLSQNRRSPQVFFVMGTFDDNPGSLSKRFHLRELPELAAERQLDTDMPIIFQENLLWPYPDEDPELHFGGWFTRHFPYLKRGELDLGAIATFPENSRRVLIFPHTIDATDWEPETLESLKWYLPLWDFEEDDSGASLLVFIHVLFSNAQLQDSGPSGLQAIQSQIRDLGNQFDFVHVLPRLRPVKPLYVELWFQDILKTALEDQQKVTERIFGAGYDSGTAKVPMKKVENELLRFLREIEDQLESKIN